jgi:hypothetical protein
VVCNVFKNSSVTQKELPYSALVVIISVFFPFSDEEIKAKLAPYAAIVHNAENVPIGQSLSTLSFEDCCFGECALGDALVDSQREFVSILIL